METMKAGNDVDKYAIRGLLAGGALFAFYLIVASLLGGFKFAMDNFVSLWYWMIPLIAGFGIQIGMFFYVKGQMHKKATAEAAASTGVSAASMVACCAHHIADIAPFLGITALGLFFSKYQSTFLLTGLLSNVLGITYMVSLMETRFPKRRVQAIFYALLTISVIAVAGSYFFISAKPGNAALQQNALQTLTDSQNNVEFAVAPLSTSQFQITMNTHSVELDFDPARISALYDDSGNVVKPLRWEGDGPGGHHRSGILEFPPVSSSAKSIRLVITDTARREFEWKFG